MKETKEFEIKTPLDVAKFFYWIVFEVGINFHPDDSFKDYVNYVTKEPTFTSEQADYYDEVMEKCFKVCKKKHRDIYQIALVVMGLFDYCDGNDILAMLEGNYKNES